MWSLLSIAFAFACFVQATSADIQSEGHVPKCPCVRHCLHRDTPKNSMNCLVKCLAVHENCTDVNVTDVMDFVTTRYSDVPYEISGPLPVGDNSSISTPLTYPGYQAANFERSKLGHPYTHDHSVAFGPRYYDCTGLVYCAWASAGYYVPSSTYTYPGNLHKVADFASSWVGDIPFIYPGHLNEPVGHAMMLVGNYEVIHASSYFGKVVQQSWADVVKYIGYNVILRPPTSSK